MRKTTTSSDGQDDGAAERRWAAAVVLAAGIADAGLSHRRHRAWGLVAGLLLSATIAGGIFALATTRRSADRADSNTAVELQLIGQFVFLALALLVGVGGFIWARRNGYYITRWRHVASPLTRQEKKTARRQIAGKEDPDRRLPVVVAIARQDRRATLGVTPIFAALALLAVSTAISTDLLVIRIAEIVVVGLIIGAAIQLAVSYRRAGRFIAAHGDLDLTAHPV